MADTILLLGTHGQQNLGDELLLESFAHNLSAQRYWVNSYTPEATQTHLRQQGFDVTAFHTTAQPLALLKALWQADRVVFAGGSMLKELNASTGQWRYRSLVMVLLVCLAARLLGRPVALGHVGVGPLKSRWGQRLAGWVLRLCQSVSVRDTRSLEEARSASPHVQVKLVPDAVFAHPGISPAPTAKTNTLPVLSLNLNRAVGDGVDWEAFCAGLAEGLNRFYQTQPFVLQALPMQTGFEAEHDGVTLERFRSRLNPSIPWHPAPEDLSPQQLLGLLSGSDLLIGERLHSLILATRLGVPFVALVYDVKVQGLLETLELPEQGKWLNQLSDPAEVERLLNTSWQRRQALRQNLESRTQQLQSTAQTAFAELTR